MTGPQGMGVLMPYAASTLGGWIGREVALGANSITGGSATTTIALTGLTIPPNTLMLILTSCGTNSVGGTSLSCADCTFETIAQFDNNATNPDRRNTLFRGVSGAAPGSTITATFPGATGEKMIAAIYIEDAPITNNGADAMIDITFDGDFNVPFEMIQTPIDDHANIVFGWISDPSTGAPLTMTSPAGSRLVLDHSPGGTYTLGVYAYPSGAVDPIMTLTGGSGGAGCVIELTGRLRPNPPGGGPIYVGTSSIVTTGPNNISGLQEDDFVVRIGWPYGGDIGTSTDGWSLISDGAGSLACSYKFVTAGDVASGWTITGQTLEVAFAYRGVSNIEGITSGVLDYITASNNLLKTISGITTTVDNAKIIYVLLGFNDNTCTWSIASERFDMNTTVATDSTYSLAEYQVYLEGAAPPVSADMTGTDNFRVFALILNP